MIIGSIIVPHPPIALEEVGHLETKKMEKTIQAYQKAARKLEEWKPDTIILISPHATMYQDFFNVSANDSAYGNMGQFNAPSVSFKVQYDQEFTDYYTKMCLEAGFPSGNQYDQQVLLDHGTMVPLYFLKPYMENVKLVRVGYSGLSLPMHYRCGQLLAKAANELDRRVVVVSSGDLSHCLKKDGPYGFAQEGKEYDQRVVEVLKQGSFKELFGFENGLLAQAMECGHRSFTMMAGMLDGLRVESEMLSYEAPFGVGYGVFMYEVKEEDPSCKYLTSYYQEEEEHLKKDAQSDDPYVQLAQDAIISWVMKQEVIQADPSIKEFYDTKAGAFVTIYKNGRLRGCIGTIEATKENLGEEIVANAIASCSRDPRFGMVNKEELPYLKISVDVLKESEPCEMEDLDPSIYGVIAYCEDGRLGLLLPNLEGVDTPYKQVRIACSKGGINMLKDTYYLERFEVIRHE